MVPELGHPPRVVVAVGAVLQQNIIPAALRKRHQTAQAIVGVLVATPGLVRPGRKFLNPMELPVTGVAAREPGAVTVLDPRDPAQEIIRIIHPMPVAIGAAGQRVVYRVVFVRFQRVTVPNFLGQTLVPTRFRVEQEDCPQLIVTQRDFRHLPKVVVPEIVRLIDRGPG